MEHLKGRVAYLEGLAEGLKVNEAGTEGRVLQGVIEVLHDLVEEIEDVREEQERYGDYLEVVDEDLANLEDEYYFNAGSDDFIEAVCPKCGETVLFERSLAGDDLDVEITCPNCGEVVYSSDDDQLELTSGDDELLDDEKDDGGDGDGDGDGDDWATWEPKE